MGVLSKTAAATSSGISNDFRVLANVYKSTSASSEPLVALTSSSNLGMWTGDAIGTTGVGSVGTTDLNAVKSAVSNLLSGYQRSDVNLSASVSSADVNLVKQTISSLGNTSIPRMSSSNTGREIVSSLPE